jgi:hypothetical protein
MRITDDSEHRRVPFGLMRSMNRSPFSSSAVVCALLYEQNTWFAHSNRRASPCDEHRSPGSETPSAIGKATLVVHTNNFNGKTRLDTAGHPPGDAIEITERFGRPDLGHVLGDS